MPPPRPAEGSPFGGANVIEALAAAGLNYGPQDHGVACTGAGSHGRAWATAGYGGDPSSPEFSLWTYPPPETLRDDWGLPLTGPPTTKLDTARSAAASPTGTKTSCLSSTSFEIG
jgi:hypothetical protein